MKRDFILDNKLDMSSYKEALDLIEKSRYILIITHVNPDADTLSSALALSNLFHENRIMHKVYNVSDDLPRNLDFIERYSKITNQMPKSFDLAISVDCGSIGRFGFELDPDIPLINIDHHKSNNNFGDINIVDAGKCSTAEIVYDFFRYNGLYITKNSATALYVGIYDDSLAFTTARCDEKSFEKVNFLVKCGASPSFIADKLVRRDALSKYRAIPKVLDSLELYEEGKIATIVAEPSMLKKTGAHVRDCEEALDMVLNISIVKIAAFFRIMNNKVRVSIRSKDKIDVSKIALIFNGGGHLNAAGFSVETDDIEEARNLVLREIFEKEK